MCPLSRIELVQRRNQSTGRDLNRGPRSAKRRSTNEIGTLRALYGHALAIEQEAIQQYRKFATHLADQGNGEVADLFRRLYELSEEQARHLVKVTCHMVPPKYRANEHSWLYDDLPAPEAEDFLIRAMTPRLALAIALGAETRAMVFFKQVGNGSRDSCVRELAIELSREKESFVAWLSDLLSRIPAAFQADENCPGDPTIAQAP